MRVYKRAASRQVDCCLKHIALPSASILYIYFPISTIYDCQNVVENRPPPPLPPPLIHLRLPIQSPPLQIRNKREQNNLGPLRSIHRRRRGSARPMRQSNRAPGLHGARLGREAGLGAGQGQGVVVVVEGAEEGECIV